MNPISKSKLVGNQFLFSALLLIPLSIGIFFALTALFYHIPKFESYYIFFPWCYYFALSFAVALVCRFFRLNSLSYSAAIAGVFCFTSIVVALLFFSNNISYLVLFGTRLELMICSLLFHALMIKNAFNKQRKKEPFRLKTKR